MILPALPAPLPDETPVSHHCIRPYRLCPSSMWYHAQNETQHGPLTEADMKSLLAQTVITPQTLVWRNGMGEWLPLEQTELAKTFEVPLDEDDSWETCAYSGDRARRSEMFKIEGCWVAGEHSREAEAFVQQGGWLPRAKSGLLPAAIPDISSLALKASQLLAACVPPVCALYLLTALPMQFLFAWLEPHYALDKVEAQMLGLALSAVFNSFSTGGIFYLFSQQTRGVRPDLVQGLTAGWSFWGRLLLIQFILASTIMGGAAVCTLITSSMAGAVLFFIPGLILALRTSLSNAAAVERRLLPGPAVRQSWHVTQGHTWRTLGTYFVVGTACMIPGVLLTAILHQLAPSLEPTPVGIVLEVLFSLPAVYFLSFQFCYYKELEALRLASARNDK